MANNQNGKTEITREEFNRLVAKKRKELYVKRAIFVAIAIVILAAVIVIIVGIASLFKSINIGGPKKRLSVRQSELVGIETGSTDCIYYSNDAILVATDNKIECRLANGTLLWEQEIDGEGEIICAAEGERFTAYRFNGSEFFCFDKKGIVWKMNVEGQIDFATVNYNAEKGVLCFKRAQNNAKLIAFSFKVKDMPETEEGEIPTTATIFEKNYSTNHIVSSAVSDNGKIIAIGELSESGSLAATKLSLVNVKTGKTFFTKVFDKEVCPYISFCKNNVLVMAGNKSVYTVTAGKNMTVGTKIDKICEYTGENNSVIAAATINGRVAVVGGNVSGNSQLTIYDLENGSIKKAGEQETPKGVVACGEYFGMYTDGVVRIVDVDGNTVGSSDKFAVIKDVYSSDSLRLIVRDTTGYSVVSFE